VNFKMAIMAISPNMFWLPLEIGPALGASLGPKSYLSIRGCQGGRYNFNILFGWLIGTAAVRAVL